MTVALVLTLAVHAGVTTARPESPLPQPVPRTPGDWHAAESGRAPNHPLPDAAYSVRFAGPASDRLIVSATLPSDGERLSMAESWPGNVPEIASAGWPGLVRNLSVVDPGGQEVRVTGAGPGGWTLERPVRGLLSLEYEVDYAPLRVRGWPAAREAAFADEVHTTLIGRSVFITTPSQRVSRVHFDLPPGWHPVLPWPEVRGVRSTATVDTTDDLTENLVAFTRAAPMAVSAGGFRLRVVACGHWAAARAEVRRVVGAVLPRLVATAGSTGRGNYVLVLLPLAETGGESFRSSFAMTTEASASRANAGSWGNLIAHEVFHYWNGWRLRGADYPSSQWFQEGFTEYAANLAMVSSRLDGPAEFHARLAGHVTNYRKLATPLDAPGTHKGPPLYSGGALVAFVWDTMIREATRGRRGLDDVIRGVMRDTGGGARPYGWPDIQAALERVAPGDWQTFERRYIHGRESLPLAEALARVGLRMTEEADGAITVEADPGAPPAARALRRKLERGSR